MEQSSGYNNDWSQNCVVPLARARWEKHHPNGTTDPERRMPLQLKNNLETGDDSLKCPVTSQDNKNVETN
jgi:hypothetical protein